MEFLNYPVTLSILILTGLTSCKGFSDPELKRKFLFNPYQVKTYNEWYRVLSHSLIHADTMHLFFNMIVLYSFGQLVEMKFVQEWGTLYGSIRYLVLYSGAVAFATIPAFSKHSENPRYNSLGASGATSAVLVAAILLIPHGKVLLMMIIPVPSWLALIMFFIFESQMNKKGNSNIAHDAHLAGAIFGLGLMTLLDYRIIVNFITEVAGIIGLA